MLEHPIICLKFGTVEPKCASRFEIQAFQHLAVAINFNLDLCIRSTPPSLARLDSPIYSRYVCHVGLLSKMLSKSIRNFFNLKILRWTHQMAISKRWIHLKQSSSNNYSQ